MALTATGIGSGLDISTIVGVLVDSEKIPKEAIFNQTEDKIKAKVSAVGTLKSELSKFQDALKKLQDGKTLNQRKVSTGDSAYIKATSTKLAQSGSYKIEVEQLATAHKVGGQFAINSQQTVGEGSLDFTVNGNSFSVAIEGTDDLTAIAQKINDASDNSNVTATVINTDAGSRLVFSSNTTGTDSQIVIAANDTSGTALNDMFGSANTTQLQEAKNSIVYIDNQKVTSQTNKVSTAITGVTLELTKADLATSSTLSITQDNAAVKESVKGFVDAYNTLLSSIDKLSSYNAETKKASALQGDSIIRSLESQLRGISSERIDVGNGQSGALYDMGITVDRYGKMVVNDTKLDSVIASDMSLVEGIFATTTTGLANRFDDVANSYVKSGGIIDGRNKTYTNETSRLTDQRTAFSLKMEQLQARLQKQFNAMDLIVSQLNQQSNGLADRLNSLPGVVRQ